MTDRGKRILLKGYYGYGNFGDDVLMIVSWNFLKSVFPSYDIHILKQSNRADYFHKITDNAQVVQQPNGKYDLIFHGGGGVFFDFDEGSFIDKMINSTIKFLPTITLKLIETIRKYRKLPIEKTVFRVGMGIGVGTFTRSSVKFRTSIAFLRTFDQIYVRDHISAENYQKLTKANNHKLSTDLAFASNFWMKKKVIGEKTEKIGFIIRYWRNENINDELLKQARRLKAAQKDVVIFFFDKEHDNPLFDRWNEFEMKIWDPLRKSVNEYLGQLNQMELVVTSRAHGAIISAILEIPSIIVEIEPKLKTIADMLPNGTILAKEVSQIFDHCILMSENIESYRRFIVDDVNKKHQKIESDLEEMKDYLISVIS